MSVSAYLRSAAAGTSCGLRTFTAPAVTLAASGNSWGGLVALLAAGEVLGDKLPFAPSRLSPPALTARIVAGGACGGALAERAGESRAAGAVLGACAALAGAYGGFSVRRYLTKVLGWPDLPVALAEDAVTFTLARQANAAGDTET
jgi:uncharacterized membrane protein